MSPIIGVPACDYIGVAVNSTQLQSTEYLVAKKETGSPHHTQNNAIHLLFVTRVKQIKNHLPFFKPRQAG